jgi:DNA polymerase III gamma/tau subunit
MQRVVLELLDHFRNLLIVMHAGKDLETFDIPAAQTDLLKKQAEKTSDGRLLRIIDLLIDADGRMRYALSKRTLLEASLIRASRAATVATVDELMQEVAALKGGGTASVNEAPVDYAVKKKPSDDLERLKASWPQLIEHLTKGLPSAHQYLIDTAPVNATETHVTIGIDPEFAQEKDSLNNPRTIAYVQKTLKGFLKRAVSVNFQTLEGRAAAAPLPTDQPAKSASDKQQYYDNPAVRNVLETFSGDIEEIRK